MTDGWAALTADIEETHALLTLIRKAWYLRSEAGPLTFTDLNLEDVDLDSLAVLWLGVTGWRTAASQVEKLLGDELGIRLAASGRSVTVDGTLVYHGQLKSEPCIDEAGFFSWLASEPGLVAKVFNPNTARLGAVPPGARSTFFETVYKDEARLSAVPVEVLETAKQRRALREKVGDGPGA